KKKKKKRKISSFTSGGTARSFSTNGSAGASVIDPALHFPQCPQGITVLFTNTSGRKPEFSYISHFSRHYITV
ncbi:hypothetical protein P3396_23135, partial [Vibrio parahaemolyticus]|nr:hypothetical protein [Vibrio parahaemolyticus]